MKKFFAKVALASCAFFATALAADAQLLIDQSSVNGLNADQIARQMSSQKSNLERSSVNGVRGDQMPDYPVGGVSCSRRSNTSNNQTTVTRRCRNCLGRGVCSNCGGKGYYRTHSYGSNNIVKCGCGNGKCRTCGGTGTR